MAVFAEHKEVFIKQKIMRFYYASAYSVATTLGQVPLIFMDVVTFGTILYFFTDNTLTDYGRCLAGGGGGEERFLNKQMKDFFDVYFHV